jgi:peptidase MA superfamily protein
VQTTTHFQVAAPDPETAQNVADWAERARRDIVARWFNGVDTGWPRRVRIEVHRDHPGYFATEFTDSVVTITLWARDAHLESTVRHEVTHAVVHLRYPSRDIPRWIDEGMAVCNESAVEQKRLIAPLFQRERRYSVRQLANMREYPRDVLLFYAEGYSLADFLVRKHGERGVVRFLEASFRLGQEAAFRSELGYQNFEDLEKAWQADLRRAASLRPRQSTEGWKPGCVAGCRRAA